jgi:hypothetical protein
MDSTKKSEPVDSRDVLDLEVDTCLDELTKFTLDVGLAKGGILYSCLVMRPTTASK